MGVTKHIDHLLSDVRVIVGAVRVLKREDKCILGLIRLVTTALDKGRRAIEALTAAARNTSRIDELEAICIIREEIRGYMQEWDDMLELDLENTKKIDAFLKGDSGDEKGK